ncbi:MAG TPA: argininosuccinate synthase, partial [Microscillaceae bacterium]|nr:argininosuccinate synthase [Microscillaceae bacterium]
APIREKRLSREEEIEYLKQKGIAGNWEKAAYSINAGIWGTSIGGKETLAAKEPLPEAAYPTPLSVDAQASEVVCLHFEHGELKGIDQEFFIRPIEAIQALAARAKPYAVGRNMHTGDTIIGIKGRIGFEAAAALITIGAHHTLEKHTLTKWQMYWKDQLASWYGMFLHEAQYFEPVMRQIETFLEQTQAHVSGKAWVKLMPYHFEIQGIESASDLMNSSFGSYGEMNNAWTGEDAKGFIKLFANPLQLYYSVHPDERNL